MICFFLTGCEDVLLENEEGNFVLYVSNQSFAIDPVDIKIYIDDLLAVYEDFDVEDQHNWKTFKFNLSTGEHRITIKSRKGGAKLEETFRIIEEKHWAVVDYWYCPSGSGGVNRTPKSFSFDIQDEPIMFL